MIYQFRALSDRDSTGRDCACVGANVCSCNLDDDCNVMRGGLQSQL